MFYILTPPQLFSLCTLKISTCFFLHNTDLTKYFRKIFHMQNIQAKEKPLQKFSSKISVASNRLPLHTNDCVKRLKNFSCCVHLIRNIFRTATPAENITWYKGSTWSYRGWTVFKGEKCTDFDSTYMVKFFSFQYTFSHDAVLRIQDVPF